MIEGVTASGSIAFDTSRNAQNVDEAFVRMALVDLVLGDDATASAAARAVVAANVWPPLLRLAIQWQVIPQVCEALERCAHADAADEDVRALLRKELWAATLYSAPIVRTCARVQDLLAQAGVASVAIKGIATIATIYGAASRRIVTDADLVIEHDRLAAARTALEAAGFVDVGGPLEPYVAAVRFSRRLYNYARTFVRDGVAIDLHWQLGPRPSAALDANRILEHSVEARAERVSLRCTGPIETALIAVHHAMRGSFLATSTPKDTADLAAWWQHFGDAHGDALIAASLESGLASSLFALSRVIASRNAGDAVTRGVSAMERTLPRAERREAEHLQAFVERNLRGDSPDNMTVELMAPAVLARSIVGRLKLIATQRGTNARSAPRTEPTVRRPLIERIRGRLERTPRIVRELLRFERVASYRALARAQSRFH